MREVKTAQVTISFSEDAGGHEIPLLWEEHTGAFLRPDYNWMGFRLYSAAPSANAIKTVATDGELQYADAYFTEPKTEMLDFAGGRRVATKYPALATVQMDARYILDENGDPLVGVSFRLDPDTSEYVASEDTEAVIEVTYNTRYFIYRYKPVITFLSGIYSGSTVLYGNIVAFWGGTKAIHEVEPPSFEQRPRFFELYRVKSLVLLNEAGAWEAHPDWDTSSWSDSGAPQPGDDPNNYWRVHEIGYLLADSNGMVSPQKFTVQWEQPKTGLATYEPKYYLEWTTNHNDPDFNDAYEAVDKAEIRDRLLRTYAVVYGSLWENGVQIS